MHITDWRAVIRSRIMNASRNPLTAWREKLDYLLRQEPLQVDPAAKFKLTKDIEEARERIHELEEREGLSSPPESVSGPRAEQPGARAEPVICSQRGNVELVWIPGGDFMMGSPRGEGYDDEHPPHRVSLDGFYMARTPVTNAQYREFISESSKAAKPRYWDDPKYNRPDQPVVGVSLHESLSFCKWAGLVLPTEAQWEYACRAGTTTRYWAGDHEAALAKVGWYSKNSASHLHAVAELPANPNGLYDMHGNVWEWCLDGKVPYSVQPSPVDGARQPSGITPSVTRGGSYSDGSELARSATRGGYVARFRVRNVGFRPALRIEP